MRGITSEGMIMCASTPEKVEIISPPEGASIGDRVKCPQFIGNYDFFSFFFYNDSYARFL